MQSIRDRSPPPEATPLCLPHARQTNKVWRKGLDNVLARNWPSEVHLDRSYSPFSPFVIPPSISLSILAVCADFGPENAELREGGRAAISAQLLPQPDPRRERDPRVVHDREDYASQLVAPPSGQARPPRRGVLPRHRPPRVSLESRSGGSLVVWVPPAELSRPGSWA